MNKAGKLMRTVSIVGIAIIFYCIFTTVLTMITINFGDIVNPSSSSSTSLSAGSAIGQALATGCASVLAAAVFIGFFAICLIAYAVCFVLTLISLIRAHAAKKQVKSPAVLNLIVSIISLVSSAALLIMCVDAGTPALVLAISRPILCVGLTVLCIVTLAKSKKTPTAANQ